MPVTPAACSRCSMVTRIAAPNCWNARSKEAHKSRRGRRIQTLTLYNSDASHSVVSGTVAGAELTSIVTNQFDSGAHPISQVVNNDDGTRTIVEQDLTG